MQSEQLETKESVIREAHLRDYWKVIWQARWTVLAIFVLVVGASAVWTFLQSPVYRATATLEIQPQARRVAAGQDVSGLGAAGYGWFAEEKYHNTQVEIIKSRDVAGRVAAVLDFESDPMFAETSDAIDAFRKMIQVVPRRETGLIEISMMGGDPDRITQWVNAVAGVYVDRNLEKAQANVAEAVDRISGQFEQLQSEFSTAESNRFKALDSSTVMNTEEQKGILQDKLKTFSAELTKIQIELNRLRDTLGQIREMPLRGADLQALPELAEDPTLKEFYTSRVMLERELESAKVEYKPGHPKYEKPASELAKVEQRITDRISVIVGTLQTRFDLAQQEERYLKAQIREAETLSVEIAQSSSGYEMAKAYAESKKRVLDLINKTMNEIQIGQQMLTNNVSVLDLATPPLYPIKPRRRVNVAIGAVLGLFLGLAAAFFLDYLDNTFRIPEDIEKYLDLAVLGVIPKVDRETGLQDRGVKEAYQSLRTSVIFSSKNRRRKVILITSTSPQEGKSSTVAFLGKTLAATGDRVIIVDCDLRRPTQHLHHEMDRDGGVTNYLAAPVEQTDWSDYVKPSDPPSLDLMSSGPIPPSPPELLGSDRFSLLLASLREHYDWVLIDSPPSASLADSTLLAALADMVIIVVQYNQTDRDHVGKAVQRLRSVSKNLVGAVLNNVDLAKAYNKDYYYAGYYYEESDSGQTKKRRTPAAKVS